MAPVTRSGDAMRTFDEQPSEDIVSDAEDEDMVSDADSSVRDFLEPLQQTADRVSQQVEDFAARLHRFKSDREHGDQALWEDALLLLEDFDALTRKQLASITSGGSRAFSHRKSLGDSDAQTQKLQLEADLWILTKNLLLSSSPHAISDAETSQQTKLADLHRYSTNPAIWNAFLDSDTTGQQYETILAWLHERAELTSPPLETLLAQLTAKSERGNGAWSAGPLFTKSAIKKQKRDRAWPLPLHPSNPGLDATLRRQSDGNALITQLDPDAPTREDRYLEVQDEYYERAAWVTCWELLRRGRSISEIRAWWDERNEQWRSALLHACGTSSRDAVQSPWLRIMNITNNHDWRRRCAQLAESKDIQDPFQKAVYAILAGSAGTSNTVCETVDELLFSEFNELLIDRFACYLSALRKKEEDSTKHVYRPPPTRELAHLLDTERPNPTPSNELRQPHRVIQLAITKQDFDNGFFERTGRAAAQVAHTDGGSEFKHLMEKDNSEPVSELVQLAVQDEDSVRILVHLQLVLTSLGLIQASWHRHPYQLENNIVNYMGWLQKGKKWSLLPLYASHLSKPRYQQVLGQILNDITDQDDRSAQVRLLKKYDIDVSDVVYGIASLSTFHAMKQFKRDKYRLKAPRITERVGAGKSGQAKIRTDFMVGEITSPDRKIIQSLQWYAFVDAEKWGYACHHIANLYQYWLCIGNFAPLIEVGVSVSVSRISLGALNMNMEFADGSQDAQDGDEVDGASAKKHVHPLMRPGTTRGHLYEKSLIWLQLEQLVDALITFEVWQDCANAVEANRQDAYQLRPLKRKLGEYLGNCAEAMIPLFDPEFLTKPKDTDEDTILSQIRSHYLPECILAWNSVLYFAGHYLSRTYLVQCMELAQRVASNQNLTNAFVDSGRMKELVVAFALDSQALLLAGEQGRNKGKPSKKEKGFDMWSVQWKHDERDADLDALD